MGALGLEVEKADPCCLHCEMTDGDALPNCPDIRVPRCVAEQVRLQLVDSQGSSQMATRRQGSHKGLGAGQTWSKGDSGRLP